MKKIQKGERGYIRARQRMYMTATLICAAVVAAFFISGLILCKTRNNLLTVMAILMVLPAAKFAVDWIMCAFHKPVDGALYEKLSEADSLFFHKYECLFTTSEKPVYAEAVVITPNAVCVFSQDKNAAGAGAKKFEDALKRHIQAAGLTVTVSLFADEKAFISRVKLMSDSKNNNFEKTEPDEKELDRMNRIWHSAASMCM